MAVPRRSRPQSPLRTIDGTLIAAPANEGFDQRLLHRRLADIVRARPPAVEAGGEHVEGAFDAHVHCNRLEKYLGATGALVTIVALSAPPRNVVPPPALLERGERVDSRTSRSSSAALRRLPAGSNPVQPAVAEPADRSPDGARLRHAQVLRDGRALATMGNSRASSPTATGPLSRRSTNRPPQVASPSAAS